MRARKPIAALPLCLLALLHPGPVSAAAAAEESAPEQRSPNQEGLDRGLALLAEDDVKGAIETLEMISGGLSHEELVQLKESLGVALAYAGRKEEARQAFLELLAVAPGHVLPYTISPKATFVYQEARAEMARKRAAEIELALPPALPFDEQVELTLTCRANPLGLLQRLEVCQRVKHPAATFDCVEVQALKVDEARLVSLPAVPASAASQVDTEGAPAILQLVVTGFDAHDNEVYRGPSRAHPKEVPMGVEVPGPWYTSPWLWGGVGALVVAAAVTTTVAIILLQPTTAQLSGELAE